MHPPNFPWQVNQKYRSPVCLSLSPPVFFPSAERLLLYFPLENSCLFSTVGANILPVSLTFIYQHVASKIVAAPPQSIMMWAWQDTHIFACTDSQQRGVKAERVHQPPPSHLARSEMRCEPQQNQLSHAWREPYLLGDRPTPPASRTCILPPLLGGGHFPSRT